MSTIAATSANTATTALLSAARRWADKLRDYNAAKSPQRFAVVKQAQLEPIDNTGAPTAGRLCIATRDISETGVGFLIDQEITAGSYQIYLPRTGGGIRRKQLEVLRVQPLGLHFDVSARFITRFNTPGQQSLASGEARDEPLDQIDAGVSRLRQHQLAMHQLVRSIDRRLQRANAVPKQPE